MVSTKRARARVMAVAVGVGAAVMTGQGFATAEPVGSSDPSPSSSSSESYEGPPSSDSSSSATTSSDRSAADESTSSVSDDSDEPTTDTEDIPASTNTTEPIDDAAGDEQPPPTIEPTPESILVEPADEVPSETTPASEEPAAPAETIAVESNSPDDSETSDTPAPPAHESSGDATTPQTTADTQLPTADINNAPEPIDIGESTGSVVADVDSTPNSVSATPATTMVTASAVVAPVQTMSASTAPVTPQAGLVAATGFFLWLGVPPLGGTVPVAPPPPAWALLAVVRRFIDNTLFNSTPIVTAPPTVNSGQDAVTGAITGTINATDANNDRLVYTVTQGAKGIAVVNSDGTFTYTPNAATLATGGTDSFTVTVSDATNFHLHLPSIFGGHSTQVVVPITVAPFSANQAPTLQVEAGDPDPDTGAIVYTVTTADEDGDFITVTATEPTRGIVTQNDDGTFTYSPGTRFASGSDAFLFTADDERGGTATELVAVAVTGQYSTITVPINGNPADFVISDDGNFVFIASGPYVTGTNSYTGSFTIIDTSTFTPTVTTIPIDGIPVDFTVTPDGDRVFVTSNGYDLSTQTFTRAGSFTILDISTPTPTIVTTIAIDGRPTNTIVSADGDHVFITSVQSDFATGSYVRSLTVVDTNTGATAKTITSITSVHPDDLIVTADGDYNFVTTYLYDDSTGLYGYGLTVVDTTTPTPTITAIALGGEPDDLVVLADGDYAMVTSYLYDQLTGTQTGTLTVVDTTTPTVAATTTALYGRPVNTFVSADGDRAFVTSELYDPNTDTYIGTLTLVDTTGPTPTITTLSTDIDDRPTDLIATADGKYAYVTSEYRYPNSTNYTGTLTLVDTTTPTPRITTIAIDGRPTDVNFSADGDHVFITGEQRGTNTRFLTVVDTTTPAPTSITTIIGGQRSSRLDARPTNEIVIADSYAFVASRELDNITNVQSGTLTIVDTTSPTPTITTILIDSTPNDLTVTADGDYAFLISAVSTTNSSDENSEYSFTYFLNILDNTTSTPTITTTTIGYPSDVTLISGGDYAFFTTYLNDEEAGTETGTLIVVDTTTPTPTVTTTTIEGRPTNAILSADGKYIFITSVQFDNVTNTYTVGLDAVALPASSVSIV